MKKIYKYSLKGIGINLGRTYETFEKLRFGSIIILWDEYRKDNIAYRVIGIEKNM